jgi:ribA/ribD-fused uncharacterized protein
MKDYMITNALDTTVKNGYILFWNGPFSNFSFCSIKLYDKQFTTSEQAFMYKKAMTFDEIGMANKILAAQDPMSAKMLGRKILSFDSGVWDYVKYGIMLECCMAKYKQSKKHLEFLLEYGKQGKFVEASPYDRIWGIGLAANHPDAADEKKWLGENLLGKVLDDCYKELS